MLRILLAKDLRRAWRNPLPWLINLIMPLAITALVGLVFGGGSENGALGRIRFAVVDEDRSVLSSTLRGAANQKQAGDHLEPVFMERDDAMKLVNAGKISAVLIIETNSTRNYLTARQPVTLHLIKNPAESINPAVLEELLGVVVTALNEISRNFNSKFPEWQRVVEGKEDYHKVSFLIDRAGDKIEAAKNYLDPPLVTYENIGDETAANSGGSASKDAATAKSATGKKNSSSKNNGLSDVYPWILLGMSGMFLLFLGQNAMTDLHRELRKRTFERYQTLHQQLWPFILSKTIFATVMLLICSAILLGGGGLVFRVQWQNPMALCALVAGYGCFITALFAVLVALAPDERHAGVLNNLAGLGLGMVGGCMFPQQELPEFLRTCITPHLPSNWFVETARDLQFNGHEVARGITLAKLMVCSVVLTVLAAWLFRRKFRTGIKT